MKYEILQGGYYYHIFNRGNNKCDILSYCLLKNHFHLLVKIKDINDEKFIYQSFSNLFNSYAKSINKKYNRVGSLFQHKFKRIKIDSDEYLREVVTYININPVYHNFTNQVSEYKYSSYNALVSNKQTLLNREEVISLFDNTDNFKYYLNHKKLDFDNKIFLEED